jgi:hypothetical protein
LTTAERAAGLDGLFGRLLGDLLEAAGRETTWPPPALAPYDGMTVQQLVETRGLSPDVADALGLIGFGRHSSLEGIRVIKSGHGSPNLQPIAGGTICCRAPSPPGSPTVSATVRRSSESSRTGPACAPSISTRACAPRSRPTS